MAGSKIDYLVLLVLVGTACLLSAASVVRASDFFNVEGKVYCDTCRFGFETNISTYIQGAKVRVECKEKENSEVTTSTEGVTDATGTYKISVEEDHPDEICETVLVSSPQSDCSTVEQGRERARIPLTFNNGIASNTRFVNALGFIKDTPLEQCKELKKLYELDEY